MPGGFQNSAEGNSSFAAGRRANTIDHGDFVWADSTDEDFSSTRADQFLVRAPGGVGLGMNSPDAQLHFVKESVDLIAEDADSHVAIIENGSTTDTSRPDVLALRVQQNNPTPATNYISFFDADGRVGSIEGNSLGGVTYQSGGADFAEWLPRANPDEAIEEERRRCISGKGVPRDAERRARSWSSPSRPIFLGNSPADEIAYLYERIAFLGQVSVKVLGVIRAGDYVVPSGRADGAGKAVRFRKTWPSTI